MQSVLLVDDSRAIRNSLRVIFEDAGFAFSEAENAHEALILAKKLHPGVIILDLSMPGMSGFQAATLLKTVVPDTPIIMFTMFADEKFARLAIESGVNAVISKTQGATPLIEKVHALSNSASH